MRKVWPVLLLLGAFEPAFGQLETDSITITASRQVSLAPDEAVFFVSVRTGLSAGIDQVLALVQGSGITAANLSSVDSDNDGLRWSFTLPVPFSKIGGAIASLAGSRRPAAVTFSVQGTQVSDEARAKQACKTADLIEDAQARAQKLAAAAGFSIGPLLSISDGTGALASSGVLAFALPGVNFVSGFFLAPPPPPIACVAAVKFRLQRFH
jgi:hypothetical protein